MLSVVRQSPYGDLVEAASIDASAFDASMAVLDCPDPQAAKFPHSNKTANQFF
jgi:hypothetical protein